MAIEFETRLQTGLHNTSEIGRLRKVMLHRPGRELENLMPEYLERLLRYWSTCFWAWWDCRYSPGSTEARGPS